MRWDFEDIYDQYTDVLEWAMKEITGRCGILSSLHCVKRLLSSVRVVLFYTLDTGYEESASCRCLDSLFLQLTAKSHI